MARLQELQYITGGTKVISGVNLSPRSTRGYLKASLRCKQESLRIRSANGQRSPNGKLPTQIGEWKRMSLPAMLLGETVGEILQASQFARKIVEAVETKPVSITTLDDPRTPLTDSRRHSRLKPETAELNVRRKREKQIIRTDKNSPLLQRAKSRINFKVTGSPPKKETEKENCHFLANRVSPKHRPWARKTVIFPNPLFNLSPNAKNQQFNRTKSPVIPRTRPTTPHKFLIKTPPPKSKASAASTSSAVKFQVKIRSPIVSVSPTRPKKAMSPPRRVSPPKKVSVSPPRRVSPPKKVSVTPLKRVSPPKKVSTAAKLRRSFSPSRLASRLVSPLKSRKSSVQRSSMDGGNGGGAMMMNMMSGLKQRPMSTNTPMNMAARRV
ncbi:hypothetical protein CTI12_AA166200 [Artemisia annua]|uniref:Microtubule-binding protein TANGLED n=1 Tax=Artemisia annua TaxID=35608 RepID=A0A2U1P831_ARTAN|nr:hypothetical protein CTI12_AA166200 [Artemisia annua]